MPIEIERRELNGEYIKMNNFLPLNLVWSHYGKITTPKIQPIAFKYCDFGHIMKIDDKIKEFLIKYGIKENPNTIFWFDFSVFPNTGTHILLPGDYIIKVAFIANNTNPIYNKYNFIFADKWDDDEDRMLKNNIKIKKI